MKLQGKNEGLYKQEIFFIVILWFLVSLPVFSKGGSGEGASGAATITILMINFFAVVTGFFAFMQMLGHVGIGALCTSLYVMSVYRFDRYMVERDIPELICMAIFPVVFCEIYELVSRQRSNGRRLLTYVIFTGCVLLLAFLDIGFFEVTAITVVILVIITVAITKKWKIFLEVAVAFGVGGIAGGLFWIPKLQDLLSIPLIQERGLHFSGIFISFWKIKEKIPGTDADAMYTIPEGVGFLTLAGICILLVLWFLGHLSFREKQEEYIVGAAAVTAVLELFMTLKSFPWDRLQLANGITYRMVGVLKTPAIFLTPVIFISALAWGYVIRRYITKKEVLLCSFCTAIVLIAVIVSGIYLTDVNNFYADYYEMMQMQNGIEIK